MRYLILCALIGLTVASCQKERPGNTGQSYLARVKQNLQGSLSTADFNLLDFTQPLLTRVDSIDLYMARIPFKGKHISREFVLVHTEKDGTILDGRIVHLAGAISDKVENTQHAFNGLISISSLNRQTETRSAVTNGYIDAFLPKNPRQRGQFSHPTDGTLPAVVVVGYVNNNNTVSYAEWIALMSLFNSSNYWNYYNYYNPLNTSGSNDNGGNSSGSGNTGTGGGGSSQPILIDFENQYSDPAIDLSSYIRCFESVPDAGATCTIEIFADIPVDRDPYRLFSFQDGSPGHTFIQLKKSNGQQVVQQSIGFYPKSQWKTTLTNAPIESKLVDNGGHEFNASYRMGLSPQQLRTILNELRSLQTMRYDIDQFNCTDFALWAFNIVRHHPLEIPMYNVPGGMSPYGTSTPQGLYHQLKAIKDGAGPEAANVTMGIYKGWVGGSKGPCN